MLINEIGFDILLEEILKIKDISVDSLFASKFFQGNEDNIHITEECYSEIFEYLNNTRKISTKLFLGILSTLAYGHPPDELKEMIGKSLQQNVTTIFENIDELIPSQTNNLNQAYFQYYKEITETPFSRKLFHLLDIAHHPDLIKVRNLYGICYFLSFLSEYVFTEFDKWFKNTKRDDLKVLFIGWSCRHDHLFIFKDSKYEISINPCFKAAHVIIEYPLSRYVSYTKRNINEINASKLEDKEKLYGFLYYLIECYRGNEAKEFDENIILEEELQELSSQSYLALLNKDILEEFNINIHNYEITRRIITLVNDTKIKEELLVYLFNKIIKMLDTIQDPTTFTGYDLLIANTFGRILKELNTDYFTRYWKNLKNLIIR